MTKPSSICINQIALTAKTATPKIPATNPPTLNAQDPKANRPPTSGFTTAALLFDVAWLNSEVTTLAIPPFVVVDTTVTTAPEALPVAVVFPVAVVLPVPVVFVFPVEEVPVAEVVLEPEPATVLAAAPVGMGWPSWTKPLASTMRGERRDLPCQRREWLQPLCDRSRIASYLCRFG
jgi:hypothetical protein